jgi:two-component system chemotaxis response regulator CheB
LPKIKAHGRAGSAPAERLPANPVRAGAFLPVREPPQIVCIGSSTGGPNALAEIFGSVFGPFPVPIVIAQHVPPVFSAMLAQRLNKVACGIAFHEARDGMPILAGQAYLAPGGQHLEVRLLKGSPVAHLHDGPQENSCRPSVDVLFRSVAETYGGRSMAVVLTGMGIDGKASCARLSGLGAQILAQDEKSSVVWGMPGAVVRAGLADEVVPLELMGRRIQAAFERGAPPPQPARLLRAV